MHGIIEICGGRDQTSRQLTGRLPPAPPLEGFGEVEEIQSGYVTANP